MVDLLDVCLCGRMTAYKAGCAVVTVLGIALLPVGLYVVAVISG